jgi:hypothetical protein
MGDRSSNIKININENHTSFSVRRWAKMAKKSAKEDDYVKIASYLFLEEYKRDRKKDAPGVMYNKFITLLHRDLKNGGRDIKLPHCWYRWGDIVVEYYVPYIHWNHNRQGTTTVGWVGDKPSYNNNDEIIGLIKKNMAQFMARHKGFEGHETAKDDVYEEVPFEFQNKYKILMESLNKLRRNAPMNNPLEYIAGLFYPAMREFPENDFKSIIDVKRKFEAVFRSGLENDAIISDLCDLAEFFWSFFSNHLRLNEECHENVKRETLNILREEIEWESMKIEHMLQDYAFEFGQNDDDLVLSLLEDRKKRMDELDALMSRLWDDDAAERGISGS